jgi:hypothetical protein
MEKLIACSWSFDSSDFSGSADDFDFLIVSGFIDTVCTNSEIFYAWWRTLVNFITLFGRSFTFNFISHCTSLSLDSSQDLTLSIGITRSNEPFVSNVGLLFVRSTWSDYRIPPLWSTVGKPVSGDVVVGFVDPSDIG